MIIVYCLDENFKDLAEKSIKTVKKYNPRAKIVVVSERAMSVKGADEYYISPIGQECRHRDGIDRISDAAYLKLLLPRLLPYDHIIFMDADVECKAPLNALWRYPCKYICLCESHNLGKEQALELGVPKYGLSGMMAMNLKALREMNFEEKCFQVAKTLPELVTGWCHEETCINVAMKGKLTFIDKKWNYCKGRRYDEPVKISDVCLLHYVGHKNKEAMRQINLYSNLQEILDDIKDKDVAIIGNAKSVFDSKNGKKIDSSEFVIRFNKGFITEPESQGSRTDMLMLACELTQNEIDSYGAKWVVNRSKFYDNPVKYIVSNLDRQPLADRLGAPPSTGFMAVDMCLTAGAKSITLYGFDWEKTPTFYNPKDYKTKHIYANEERYVREYAAAGLIKIVEGTNNDK